MIEGLVLKNIDKLCSGTLQYTGIDLGKTLATYNFGFWYNGLEGYVIIDNYSPVIARVSIDGRYTIYGSNRDECREYVDKLVKILGLEEDLSQLYRIGRNDPLLGPFIEKYRGWRLRTTDPWWGLVIGICQQNASFLQGWRMLYNIVKLYNRKILLYNREILLPPHPRDILEKPELLIKARTGYRAETIARVAREFVENNLAEKILDHDPDHVEKLLRSIKGVGIYTARLAMVLSMRIYEKPPIDRWLSRIIIETYGVEKNMVEEYWISRWSRWSGLASVMVTIALDAEPLRKALERIRENKLLPIEDLGKPSPLTMWRYFK